MGSILVHFSKGNDIYQHNLLASLLPSYLFLSKSDGVNDQLGDTRKGTEVLSTFLLSFWDLSAFREHVFFSTRGHELSLVLEACLGEAYNFLILFKTGVQYYEVYSCFSFKPQFLSPLQLKHVGISTSLCLVVDTGKISSYKIGDLVELLSTSISQFLQV